MAHAPRGFLPSSLTGRWQITSPPPTSCPPTNPSAAPRMMGTGEERVGDCEPSLPSRRGERGTPEAGAEEKGAATGSQSPARGQESTTRLDPSPPRSTTPSQASSLTFLDRAAATGTGIDEQRKRRRCSFAGSAHVSPSTRMLAICALSLSRDVHRNKYRPMYNLCICYFILA